MYLIVLVFYLRGGESFRLISSYFIQHNKGYIVRAYYTVLCKWILLLQLLLNMGVRGFSYGNLHLCICKEKIA